MSCAGTTAALTETAGLDLSAAGVLYCCVLLSELKREEAEKKKTGSVLEQHCCSHRPKARKENNTRVLQSSVVQCEWVQLITAVSCGAHAAVHACIHAAYDTTHAIRSVVTGGTWNIRSTR